MRGGEYMAHDEQFEELRQRLHEKGSLDVPSVTTVSPEIRTPTKYAFIGGEQRLLGEEAETE
jgi:hypothetical protein